MKKLLFLLSVLFSFNAQSQIIIDNTAPYNTATYLIDSVLLGGGVTATNHAFQGDASQIAWFDGSNSNVGIDTGNEELQRFIGEYTKKIDLTNNAKGIYFLEIETNGGVINKKLILQ